MANHVSGTLTRQALYRAGDKTHWRGSRASSGVPSMSILTETNIPILAEDGQYLYPES